MSMNLQKKMSEKQVASNFKPEEESSNLNLPLQSQVAGIEKTSSYAEDSNLEIEFSDLSISSTVSPEFLPSVSLKSNVLENHSIDFDQRQKIVLSTHTDGFPAIKESDYEIRSKNVEKCIKIQNKSFVDSYKKPRNGRQENYLKNDDCLNSPKSQSSVCFLSPSLTNRELIVPASADKSTPYIVRIRKTFYDDALLPSAKTKDNEGFIRHLIQKENEAGFEQNDSGGSMEEKSFNTSDDMFSYSREENISGGSSNISGVQSGNITKDSSPERSYLENLSYYDMENANFSGDMYYTPCKNNSNFMKEGGLFRYIEENIFGESSTIPEVESDKILKYSPSYFLENQREEVTYTAKEVKNDMDNINSQNLIQENTADLPEEMSHFSTEQNNAFIDSQAKPGKILNCTHKFHLENETFLEQEETTVSKNIESDIMNPSSSQSLILENSANLAEKLYHSIPEKHKSDESLINSHDKVSKILNDARQYRLENDDFLNKEETSSTVGKQTDFIELEMVDIEKVTDKCIDEIIKDTHHYVLENETNKEEISSTEGKKQGDYLLPEITTIQKIMYDCNDEIIDNTCQCDLENEISFDEREKILIEKIGNDIKSADSKSLISENFARLVEEVCHSTPKNNSGDSIFNSDCETSKIPNPYEYDLEIETFLKKEATNSTEEKEIYCIRPEMQKSMGTGTDEAYLCMDKEDTFNTFSNIFEMETSQIMNELQQEWQETVSKVERNEIEQFIAEQVYSEGSIQEKRPIHFTGVCDFNDTKRNSNEFTHVSQAQNNVSINILPKQNEENEQTMLKKDESKENVLQNFMQEPQASGLGDYTLGTSQVVSEIVTNCKRKLRPRKRKLDLCNENLPKKRKTNISKSPVEVSNKMSRCTRGSSSVEIINHPVKTEIEKENAEDRNSKSNVIHYTNDIETQNEIQTANLIENRRELNKVCSAQTLFDLFSIDQVISMGTLKSLSSKELRSGALFIQIIRFLRQDRGLTVNSKIKEDVKKFLTAAMDAGWIEKKNKRYKLIGDANLVDNKTQTKHDVTKGAKILQPKKQTKVSVSKRTKILQSKKQAKASKLTKIKQPKIQESKPVGGANVADNKKQTKSDVTKGAKISKPKKQAKAPASKATKITQPKNQESKPAGGANLVDNKRQTRADVNKGSKVSQPENQAKAAASKVMKITQSKNEESKSAGYANLVDNKRQTRADVTKGSKVSQPEKQAKATASKVTQSTQPKNYENKSAGKVNLIDDKKQTKIAATNETEASQPKKQAKAIVCKRKKVSQPIQDVKDSVTKRSKVSQPKQQAKVNISKGKQILLPKQQAKRIMAKEKKISHAKMQLRNQR